MTKRDFEDLAKVLKREMDSHPSWSNETQVVINLAHSVANVALRRNVLFDRERFLTACGVR